MKARWLRIWCRLPGLLRSQNRSENEASSCVFLPKGMMKSYEIRLQGAACLNRDFNKAVAVLRLLYQDRGSLESVDKSHTSHRLASKIMQNCIRYLRSWHPQADEPNALAPCLGSCPQAREAIGGKKLQMHMVSSSLWQCILVYVSCVSSPARRSELACHVV